MAEKEYIERKSTADSIRKSFDFFYQIPIDSADRAVQNIVNRAKRIVQEMPAADVVEVVHGEWIPSPDGIHPIKCSNCGADAPYRRESDFTHDIGIRPYKSNYCPNCFAKMDGGKHETD